MNSNEVQEQIENNRRSVSFDSYDITVRQLFDMIQEGLIDIAPEYQRHFVWDNTRQSQLVESLILGIPVPNLFMATNKDSSWEVIDGLQRLTTLVNFLGDIRLIKKTNANGTKLKLGGLEKLDTINSCEFEDLPKSIQLMFMTRPIRVTVLNDRSDFELRYDLFERLNTGGVTLHPQEIRNCVYLGRFKDFIVDCAKNEDFINVVKMTEKAERTGNREELVLKFFAYFEDRHVFVHSVKEFLNDYMAKKTDHFPELHDYKALFEETFGRLRELLPEGIVRGNRKNITPLVLFEAVSVATADIIRDKNQRVLVSDKLRTVLNNGELKKLTTGATNSRNKLLQRIEFVKQYIS
tara:strand:- start:1011 stop:2063 length:1053 start_codon:yes stop_codon:yes gene_type:complete